MFQGELKRQLCLQNPFTTHLFFVHRVSKCVYVNTTYPKWLQRQKKNLPSTLEGDKMLKHTNLQCFVFKSLFGFLISCEKHHFMDYSSEHKLPTVSYRHRARSTAEGHKPPAGVSNMGHLRLNAQRSSTFLRLHVTELPVSQLHFRAQTGRTRMQLKHVFNL